MLIYRLLRDTPALSANEENELTRRLEQCLLTFEMEFSTPKVLTPQFIMTTKFVCFIRAEFQADVTWDTIRCWHCNDTKGS